jgi:hypothetical protein
MARSLPGRQDVPRPHPLGVATPLPGVAVDPSLEPELARAPEEAVPELWPLAFEPVPLPPHAASAVESAHAARAHSDRLGRVMVRAVYHPGRSLRETALRKQIAGRRAARSNGAARRGTIRATRIGNNLTGRPETRALRIGARANDLVVRAVTSLAQSRGALGVAERSAAAHGGAVPTVSAYPCVGDDHSRTAAFEACLTETEPGRPFEPGQPGHYTGYHLAAAVHVRQHVPNRRVAGAV